MTIDVYSQYFAGQATVNGVARHAVLVFLQSDSEAGQISYSVNVNFFPHNDETDFAVSYDAIQTEVIFSGKGRRSKKREAEYMQSFRAKADELAAKAGGTIDWEKPLREARLG